MEQRIRDMLKTDMSFEDYFISVCELKVSLDKEFLKDLRKVVKENANGYSDDAIAYLCDCIDTEKLLPCNQETRKFKEKQMCQEVVENFEKYFPEYVFVQTEKKVLGVGRIDIYALHNNKPVIIELKAENKNPNLQLIAYGSRFIDRELVAITEKELPEKEKVPEIKYYTINDLRESMLKNKYITCNGKKGGLNNV